MPDKVTFRITYDGPSLSTHEMDVRDLAPALMAISDTLDEANKVVYGDVNKIQVNVKGSFQTGSFNVEFSVFQPIILAATSLFASDNASAAANLLQYWQALISFLKWLKNRKIKKISRIDGKATIEVDDEQRVEEEKVIELFADIKIRASLQKVITEPLTKPGVTSFTIKHDNKIIEVNETEKEYFRTPDVQDEPLRDEVRQVFLTALSVSFMEDNKWRFSDGNVSFYASVKDETFLEQVQANRDGFFKDDIFEVQLRERQWISDTGIKTEYEIAKVLSHRSASKQIKLPFDQ